MSRAWRAFIVGGSICAVARMVCFSPLALAAVTISTAPTAGVICSSGQCTPTATDAVLNVSDLQALLANGSVTVRTAGSGGIQATDIVLQAPLRWQTASVLGLDAFRMVTVNEPIAVAGGGGLAVTFNDGGSGGRVAFERKGRLFLRLLASQLAINGRPYRLFADVKSLAAAMTANPAGSFALARDYDAGADGEYRNSLVLPPFTGQLEGLGNTISNLTINVSGSGILVVGLVSQVESQGSITNINLATVDIMVLHRHVAGTLVGINNGFLADDHATGVLVASGSQDAGGLVGRSYGTILYSSTTVSVTANQAGGLAGYDMGLISHSSASGPVTSHTKIASNGEVFYGIAGGLVGSFGPATIEQCYASGSVTAGAKASVGGLAGSADPTGTVSNSYASGALVTGAQGTIGGLVGLKLGGSVTTSYSISSSRHGAPASAGGLIGSDAAPSGNANSYWDITTGPPVGTENGVTGLITAQLKSGLPAGFDPAIWTQRLGINGGFPYLISVPLR